MTIKEALEILYNTTALEIVYETHQGRDFVEVIGNAGGDPLRYRVYNDGSVYQK